MLNLLVSVITQCCFCYSRLFKRKNLKLQASVLSAMCTDLLYEYIEQIEMIMCDDTLISNNLNIHYIKELMIFIFLFDITH